MILGRLRTAALVLCVALALAAAPAPAQVPAQVGGYPEQIGAAALDLIDYPWRELGWEIRFLPGRSGFLGLAIGEERRIEIFVRPDHTVTDVAHTVAHELGHAVDMTWGTDYRRAEYRRLRGFSQRGKWFGCDECTDYATPAGDYAEVFEYWLLGGGDYRSQLGPAPDPTRLEHMSHLFVAPYPPSVRIFWQQRWRPAP